MFSGEYVAEELFWFVIDARTIVYFRRRTFIFGTEMVRRSSCRSVDSDIDAKVILDRSTVFVRSFCFSNFYTNKHKHTHTPQTYGVTWCQVRGRRRELRRKGCGSTGMDHQRNQDQSHISTSHHECMESQ